MTSLPRTRPKCGAILAADARYCQACFLQTGLDLLVEGDDMRDDSPDSATLSEFGPAESAIIATLAPGSYTAIAKGVNGGTGVGVIEVFALP